MTAIAGVLGDIDPSRCRAICQQLINDLLPYGGDGERFEQLGSAEFGRALRLGHAEDQFDLQPLRDEAEQWLFVADCRLDSPSELSARLGINPHEHRRGVADAAVLFSAWLRWGVAGLDSIAGDYAFAAFHGPSGKLFLARSLLSSKPLFFSQVGRGLAFASMPLALFRLTEVDRSLDLAMLARKISIAMAEPGRTIYSGVTRIEPGTAVTWDGNLTARRFSELRPAPPTGTTLEAVGEEFEDLLTQAVRSRCRRHHGSVASELSSGRDSSAVTAFAARIMAQAGEPLLALTHAPSRGREHPVWPGRFADESEVAAKTASIHPNIEHLVLRSNAGFHFDTFRECERAAQYPLGHPCNMVWEQELMRTAAERGATVLLTGAWGNFTISSGGGVAMSDLLKRDGLGAWFREMRKADALRPGRALFILNSLATAFLPRPLLQPLRQWAERVRSGPNRRVEWLRPQYQGDALAASTAAEIRFEQSYSDVRRDVLRTVDQGGGFAIAYAGIEERDPTADRRLAEFCLGLDPRYLIDMPAGRPVYDRALRGKVAEEVLAPRARGMQGADWYELLPVELLREWFNTFRHQPEFNELVDVAKVDLALASFPTSGWGEPEIYQTYRDQLLKVLEIGSFIHFIRTEVRA